VVIRVDPCVVVTLLAKHLRDYDAKVYEDACEYATRPMAKMPCSDGDGFRLAAPLLSHRLRCTGVTALTKCEINPLCRFALFEGTKGRREEESPIGGSGPLYTQAVYLFLHVAR
jgi:hypothetical protein